MLFRRQGLGLVPWYATEAVFWLFAATFAMAFLVALFGVGHLKWTDLFVTALIGVMVWPPARFAWHLRAWIRLTRSYYLRTSDDGVQFHLPGAVDVHLAWHEIQAVTRQKRWIAQQGLFPFAYRNVFYTLVTARGSFTFTSMEIPSPSRAASAIAAKLAMDVQTLAPA